MSSEAVGINTSAGKLWYLTISVLVLALDQLTKLWVARELYPDGEINIIDGFLKISYTENPGIAFGMLSDGNVKWLLVAVSAAAITIVIFYLLRTPASNSLLLWSLALLAAGISGNLVDRVRMGRVIDFIEVYYRDFHWPVFNVADTAISIGAALMAIELFFSSSPRKATSEELKESPVEESPES
jgi:signal peptidase II